MPLDRPATAGDAARPAGHAAWRPRFAFGKYREIIIAVGFFLLFDLGVLLLNFYTSFKIDQDTVAINLAGRQRYTSQRIARTLLELDAARAAGQNPRGETLAELRASVKIFDQSHEAFRSGATVPGGDGKPVFLDAVTSPRGRALEAQVEAIWRPYADRLKPLLTSDSFTPGELAAVLNYSQSQNANLLRVANDFVTETQAIGASRASTLRMVQTGGIVLALLNFAFILFKFIRRLQLSDAAINAANDENRDILTSVREGLFLITPDFALGSQLSNSAHVLFGRPLAPGDDFFELLRPLVSDKALSDAHDYVALLFAPHVKESLVQGINPLSEVEVAVTNRLGTEMSRHLSFHFNRVQDNGAIRHLLVTVQDISHRVELERKLLGERQRSQKEFAMLLKAAEADPAQLRGFVVRAEAGLLEVNGLLRDTSAASGEAAMLRQIDAARRRVHAIKGDAATLGLESLAGQVHAFENELDRIRQIGGSGDGGSLGNALLALPPPLEELLDKIGALKSLTGAGRAGPPPTAGTQGLDAALARLAADVARDTGKQVAAEVRVGDHAGLPATVADGLREVAVQLVRNAVVHGIETPAERTAAGKPAEGRIEVRLGQRDAEWALTVRDDGAGLSAPHVRQRLLALGWYTAEQLESFDDRQIVSHIFRAGFSTAGGVSLHAGRGVGLDLVVAHAQNLGARITLQSTPGVFTEIAFRFAA